MAQNIGNINLYNNTKSTIADKSNDPIGAYYLASHPEFYEPQRGNTFSFYVYGLDQLSAQFGVTTDGTDDGKVLELAVKASSVPHLTVEKLTINRGNSQMHFAGKGTFENHSITVRDYIGAHTKEILLAWQRQAYNVETEKVGLSKDYKRTAHLIERTPDFSIVRTWVLEGCWISSITEGNYDHDSSDAKTMDVTIVFDKAYIDTSSI